MRGYKKKVNKNRHRNDDVQGTLIWLLVCDRFARVRVHFHQPSHTDKTGVLRPRTAATMGY